MKWCKLLFLLVGKDGSLLIDGFSNDVDDTSKSQGSYRNLNGSSGIRTLLSTDKTVGGLHGNGTYGVFSKMLGYFENKTFASFFNLDFKGVENLGELLIELLGEGNEVLKYSLILDTSQYWAVAGAYLNIDNGSNYLGDFTRAQSTDTTKASYCTKMKLPLRKKSLNAKKTCLKNPKNPNHSTVCQTLQKMDSNALYPNSIQLPSQTAFMARYVSLA